MSENAFSMQSELDPDADQVSVELPADLQPEAEGSAPGAVPAEIPKTFDQAEAARERFKAELARLRATDTASRAQAEPEAAPDYNNAEDLNQAFSQHEERLTKRLTAEQEQERQRALIVTVHMSQELARIRHADYDAVLERSKLMDRLNVDPKTGQAADPFLHHWIYSQLNPAQAAYDYALGLLERDEAAKADQRSRSEAHPTTEEPAGVTRAQIDRMTDDQKRRLKKEQPHVWAWYLGG